MRLPVEWLHEYVRPDLDARELATRLAMTGTEVDRICIGEVCVRRTTSSAT